MVHGLRAQIHVFADHSRWHRAFYQEHLGQPDSVVFAPPAHGKMDHFHNICAASDCAFVSSKKSELEQHALEAGHLPFPCTCGAQFARAFCLTRHINSMMGPGFQCDLCDDRSFPRRDKLDDHLRRWHRLGAKALDQYKGGNSPPGSVSLPSGGVSPPQAQEPQQACPVAPGFDAMSVFNGFPSATDTAPDASSVQSNASPCISTVSSDVLGYHTTDAPG